MSTRVIQRSPDVGIGIRMQRVVAAITPIAATPEIPFFISVADSTASDGGGVVDLTLVHSVVLSKATATSQEYAFSIVLIEPNDGSGFTIRPITDSNFTDGVTLLGSTITVPAGVVNFSISIITTDRYASPEIYQVQVARAFGVGTVTLF